MRPLIARIAARLRPAPLPRDLDLARQKRAMERALRAQGLPQSKAKTAVAAAFAARTKDGAA